jgi:hypothetical protein
MRTNSWPFLHSLLLAAALANIVAFLAARYKATETHLASYEALLPIFAAGFLFTGGLLQVVRPSAVPALASPPIRLSLRRFAGILEILAGTALFAFGLFHAFSVARP